MTVRPIIDISLAYLVATASLLLAACGTTTHYAPTNAPPGPMTAKPAHAVDVYTTSTPDVPFVEVGIIQSRQTSTLSMHDMPQIIAHMRKRAGHIGCDAVIINGIDNKTITQIDELGKSTESLDGYWGACIVYAPTEQAPG